jgi:hypothetical protein
VADRYSTRTEQQWKMVKKWSSAVKRIQTEENLHQNVHIFPKDEPWLHYWKIPSLPVSGKSKFYLLDMMLGNWERFHSQAQNL